MLTSVLTLLALGASSISAYPSQPVDFAPHTFLSSLTHPSPALARRQKSQTISFGGQAVPLTCESICTSTAPIYDQCLAGNTQGCLGVCTILEEFVQCANCVTVNDDGSAGTVSISQWRTAETQLNGIIRTCAAQNLGSPPTTQLVTYDQIGSNSTSGSAQPSSTTTTGASQPSASAANGNTSGADKRTGLRMTGWAVGVVGVGAAMLL